MWTNACRKLRPLYTPLSQIMPTLQKHPRRCADADALGRQKCAIRADRSKDQPFEVEMHRGDQEDTDCSIIRRLGCDVVRGEQSNNGGGEIPSCKKTTGEAGDILCGFGAFQISVGVLFVRLVSAVDQPSVLDREVCPRGAGNCDCRHLVQC